MFNINSKKNKKSRELNSLEDYYLEGIDYEQQGERWLHSDAKKSLRNYLLAYENYEKGLVLFCGGAGADRKSIYDIKFNMTRISLVLYSEYVYNDNGINILRYVKMDDMPQNLNKILLTLPEIIVNFEKVYVEFEDVKTWDFDYNLITCYLSYIENEEMYVDIGKSTIDEITDKMVAIIAGLVNTIEQEVIEYNEMITSINGKSQVDSGVEQQEEQQGDEQSDIKSDEYMEVSDTITNETLPEVFCIGYKYIIGLFQRKVFKNDKVTRLYNDLNSMVNKHSHEIVDCEASNELKELIETIKGMELYNQPIELQTQYLDQLTDENVKASVLEFFIEMNNVQEQDHSTSNWKLCSQLNKCYNQQLKTETNFINKLSTMLNLAEIEIQRYKLSKTLQMNENTINILQKNCLTLLNNIIKLSATPPPTTTINLQDNNLINKIERQSIKDQATDLLNI